MGRCFDVLVLQQRGEFVLAQIKGSLRAFQVFEGRADYVLEFVWDGGSQSLRHYFRKPLSARLTEMARLGMALARVWKIRQLRRRKK